MTADEGDGMMAMTGKEVELGILSWEFGERMGNRQEERKVSEKRQ